MGVVWVEKSKTGDKRVTRVDYATGKRDVLYDSPKPMVERGVKSASNGVIGGKKALAEAKALDAKLGVSDKIEYRPMGNGAYVANYDSIGNYDKWMFAHKRVNHDAGCGTPCPGDFKGQFPGEFD